MCRSKAEGGRRCPGDGHAQPGNAGDAAASAAVRPADHLAAELGAAAERLAGEGGAQYALEETAAALRRAYADAGRLGPLDGEAEALRAQMLDVAESIDTGLGDEHADRRYLREDAEEKLRNLAAASGAPSPARPQVGEDYAAYLRRSAELDRRVAAGESVTDIMRAEQLARGEAMIREMTWP
jgi:hypothetical protein